MRNKAAFFIIFAALGIGLAACSNGTNQENSGNTQSEETEDETETASSEDAMIAETSKEEEIVKEIEEP